MLGSLSLVDLLFLATIVLLVFNGLRNGFVFSLVNLISLPAALVVAWIFGPRLTDLLAGNNLPATPLISYIVLFFGTVLIIHILATGLRGVKKLPVIGFADTLLGGVVGFVEAWLLWLIFLLILHSFLQNVDQIHSLGITTTQLDNWQNFYDTAVTNSLFARVNSTIAPFLPIK